MANVTIIKVTEVDNGEPVVHLSNGDVLYGLTECEVIYAVGQPTYARIKAIVMRPETDPA